ncbi:uncharacterized protein LOC143150920 [Ptiloglossa arizonensis]|uniref:uncharacterized protein LOC143150920 n=1 Tax=Ptiloglossa arizonensis TaxID=3350558 RepID=UPI003FA0F71D
MSIRYQYLQVGHPIVTETDIDVLSSVIRQSEASITAMKTVVQVNVCAENCVAFLKNLGCNFLALVILRKRIPTHSTHEVDPFNENLFSLKEINIYKAAKAEINTLMSKINIEDHDTTTQAVVSYQVDGCFGALTRTP